MKTKAVVIALVAVCVGVASAVVVLGVGYAALAKYGWIHTERAVALRKAIQAEQAPWEQDLHINASCSTGGSAGVWVVNVRNSSKTHAYRDLSYRTEYYAESGTSVARGSGELLIVVRPGEDRRVGEVNDGFVPAQARTCRMKIVGATAAVADGAMATE